MVPPPLPLDGEERGPHRPAPLGRLSPNYSDLDDNMLSPIRRRGGRREDDYSDGDSTGSEDDEDSPRHRHSPRGGWVEVQNDRDRDRERDRDRDRERDRDDRGGRHRGGRSGPLVTSSPIPQGFNL
jgi:ATP-dependent RNA helicase DDX23/PRP28